MIKGIKEYILAADGPLDISCWISNALLDITATLTADRDHDGIRYRDQLHPALATLNNTMAFLWGFLQFQRLPGPLIFCIRKLTSALLGRVKFFERNTLSGRLVSDRLANWPSHPERPDYGNAPRAS